MKHPKPSKSQLDKMERVHRESNLRGQKCCICGEKATTKALHPVAGTSDYEVKFYCVKHFWVEIQRRVAKVRM